MSERPEPPVHPLTEPFWDATRERRLVLQWCRACEASIHYPREACPRCFGSDLAWRESTGSGVVYAATVLPLGGIRVRVFRPSLGDWH